MSHSTFSGNSAPNGGGIYLGTGITLIWPGRFLETGGKVAKFGGTFTDNGYNLSDDGSCAFGGTSATNATLNLGALQDNGGPTWTHALLTGSAAIDAIPSTAVQVAQIAGSRLRRHNHQPPAVTLPQGSGCDAGAFELERHWP